MARGKFYTKEEDERIVAVCNDNEDLVEAKKYKDIAKKMQKYGICPNRDADALSQHISRLLNPEPEDDEKEICTEDVNNEMLQIELDKLKEKYESLIHVLIDECTETKNGFIQFVFPSITKWLKENETSRYWERFADIQQKNNAN